MKFSTMARYLTSGAAFAAALLSASTAAAWRPSVPFSGADLAVADAKVVFANPAELHPLLAGTNLVLARAGASALTTGASHFEIRIFSLGPGNLPGRYLTEGDCDIFLSMVFPGVHFTGNVVDLGPLDGSWLDLNSGFEPVARSYLLVVEQVAKPDERSRSAQWQMFRLKRSDEQRYFALGRVFEVAPNRELIAISVAQAQAADLATADRLKAAARYLGHDVFCYKLTDNTGVTPQQLVYFRSCGSRERSPTMAPEAVDTSDFG